MLFILIAKGRAENLRAEWKAGVDAFGAAEDGVENEKGKTVW